jgi:hypothetical protein
MIADRRGMARTDVIDAYVAELDRTLRGPRRAKADLLAEVRDSLQDATEAHGRGGLPPEDAEAEAVAEFGAVPDIAPAYQTELGVSQARRTALLVFGVLAALQLASRLAWHSGTPSATPHPAWYAVLALLVDWCCPAVLLAAAGCVVGARRLGPGRGLARPVGVFAAAVAGAFAAAGLLLTFGNPAAGSHLTLATLVWALAVLGAMGWVGSSARRCLAAA